MKKKMLMYGTSFVILFLILFALDKYKIYKEEEPPIPNISVEGVSIKAHPGPYDWRGSKKSTENPVEMLAGLPADKVKEDNILTIAFPEGSQPKKITISEWDSFSKEQTDYDYLEGFPIPYSHKSWGIVYLIINAEWKNDSVSYYLKLNVEQNYYGDMLAKKEGALTAMAVVPSGEGANYDLPAEVKKTLEKFEIYDDIEFVKEEFSGLSSWAPSIIPVYFVFNNEDLAFTTKDKAQMIQYLQAVPKPPYIGLLAPRDGEIRVLAVVPPGEKELTDSDPETKGLLNTFEVRDDLEGVKKEFPGLRGLTAAALPVYYVFNNKKPLITTFEKEEWIMFIEFYKNK
ncbi:hypothetical protein M3204_23560 [Mesobacillus subterraneus]|uniref:hypothetical protein n=1 Tax=Mesobacillus subterraneus TaxID=285983 RepID=UPI00203A9448|nr:hypothetical protein [Mesobacillus subterraneus]MCM3667356.1 hypothetical protein [Mesobacillus subterraneus]MCM3686347.1 hypothetical protein [Mesobacillus subterraneus]